MKTMTLAQAMMTELVSDDFRGRVSRFDPVEETFTLEGISYLKHADGSHWMTDPVAAFRGDLREFDIDVQYSHEERKMIEDAKLTKQVAMKSADLLAAMTAWLNRPGGR